MTCAPCSAALSAKAMLPPSRSLGRRFVGQGADGALAAGADDERAAEPVEQRQAVHQLEIMGDGLAEAEAGIDEQVRARDPGRVGRGDALLEPLDRSRPARRRSADRPASTAGSPWWCISTTGTPGRRSHLGRALVEGQRRDVVDHPRPGLERCRHDVGLARVDRHRRAARGKLADDRHHPLDLIAFPHRCGARPGRFAADVDDRRALGRHVRARFGGGRRIGKVPAVGKAVGRDVDDAHHLRLVEADGARRRAAAAAAGWSAAPIAAPCPRRSGFRSPPPATSSDAVRRLPSTVRFRPR